MSPGPNLNFATEYRIDAWQRSILTLDTQRERGNICLEHNAQNAPNVLSFEFEPIRLKEQYLLVRLDGERAVLRRLGRIEAMFDVVSGTPALKAAHA